MYSEYREIETGLYIVRGGWAKLFWCTLKLSLIRVTRIRDIVILLLFGYCDIIIIKIS